ncbi:hypothetical protein ON010_g17453 [Phytophthora cinnamomi]|nr:hypothetical protein ON010_g17453 [Phytophthora cinnamomi]
MSTERLWSLSSNVSHPIDDGMDPRSVSESPTNSSWGRKRGRTANLTMTLSHAPNDHATKAPSAKNANNVSLALENLAAARIGGGRDIDVDGGSGDSSEDSDDEGGEFAELDDSDGDDSVSLSGEYAMATAPPAAPCGVRLNGEISKCDVAGAARPSPSLEKSSGQSNTRKPVHMSLQPCQCRNILQERLAVKVA